MPQQAEPRADPQAGLSAKAYAFVTLIGLLIGIGLLLFFVYQVPKLVENSAQNRVFYLLLIPWALSCAAFLFGAMRAYARFTHKHLGTALELSGPVVLFCLVLVGGFKLVPSPLESFDLTVRAHSTDDPLIRSGKITVELDNTLRSETIESNGEANFKGIPTKFKGSTVRILPQVSGYRQEWQQHALVRNTVELVLKRQPPVHLTGSIVPPPMNWSSIRILVDGSPVEGKLDGLGRFDLAVGGREGDRIRLKIYANTRLVYDDFQTLPGPITLSLHGMDRPELRKVQSNPQ
jgi:hypothetical protein